MVGSGPDQSVGRDDGDVHPMPAVILKIVLGVVGFIAFALLGAGGALLVKHLRTPGPASTATAAVKTPVDIAPASAPSAASAPPLRTPAVSEAAVPPTATRSALITDTLPPLQPAPRNRAETRHTHAARADTGAGTETGPESSADTAPNGAGRASCLATLNALNSDLSLRNEPPTPQQIAILKRGCK